MTKEEKDTKKKLAEGKKASRKADSLKTKNKINEAAKKVGEKQILEISANLPAGHGNAFVKLHLAHQKADEAVATAQKVRRNVRADMKAIKIDMSAYDRVNKLTKMDPSDVAAKKATEALYEQQLSMPLSAEQKKLVDDINRKRDAARQELGELDTDSDTGKEVGSGIGHNSGDAGDEGEAEEKAAAPSIPAKNEAIKLAATTSTH